MAPLTSIYGLGLLALPAAVLVVAYLIRGIKRGWFRRRDGTGRIRRTANPAVFWFEVIASAALAVALAWIGLWAAAKLLSAGA